MTDNNISEINMQVADCINNGYFSQAFVIYGDSLNKNPSDIALDLANSITHGGEHEEFGYIKWEAIEPLARFLAQAYRSDEIIRQANASLVMSGSSGGE